MHREPESYIHDREVADELRLGDDQVLAIDILDNWAAVFQFSIADDGWYRTNTTLAVRSPDGRWEDMSGGGMTGTRWELPWRRPQAGWSFGHLLTLGTTGRDVELDDGTDQFLIAVAGFASAATHNLHVTNNDLERVIVPAPTGAFVALGVGSGDSFLTLSAADEAGSLGTALSFPTPLDD